MFHVGQQVVCMHVWCRADTAYLRGERYPAKGGVYTVREIELPTDGEVYLRFEELVNPPRRTPAPGTTSAEVCFAADKFRPVRKTDISIFTAMLSPAPKEGADA